LRYGFALVLVLSVSERSRATETAAEAPAWRWVGAERPDIAAVGNSHRTSVVQAIHRGLTNVPGAVLTRPRDHPDDEYWHLVEQLDPAIPIAFLYRGNETNIRFIFEASSPFTVIHPARSAPTGDPVVPVEMVRALFTAEATELAALLDRFADRRTVLVEPPPPQPSVSIEERVRLDESLIKQIAGLDRTPDEIRVTPLDLRIALNAILRELQAEIAETRGVPVLPPPRETVATDGSLLPQYALDATHANGAYGALVWRDLAAHFGVRTGNAL
jgi:hypothetical protein